MRLKELREVLEKFHWNKYDIDAYCVLVERGVCLANDISIKANIPSGRIHSVLLKLYGIGAVKKIESRPVKYEAFNPNIVVQNEINKINKLWLEAEKEVMPIWEARAEEKKDQLPTSIVEGISGIVNGIRDLLFESEDSFLLVLDDLDWISSKDISRFRNLIKSKTKIIIVSSNSQNLEDIVESGVIVKCIEKEDTIEKKYCISDNKRILWISEKNDSGVIIEDIKLAKILYDEYRKYYEKIPQKSVEII